VCGERRLAYRARAFQWSLRAVPQTSVPFWKNSDLVVPPARLPTSRRRSRGSLRIPAVTGRDPTSGFADRGGLPG
jgi:hypothetical protein